MKSRDFFKSFPGMPQQKKVIEKQQKLTLKLFFDCPGSFFVEKSGEPKLLGPVSFWSETNFGWKAKSAEMHSDNIFFSTESASEKF